MLASSVAGGMVLVGAGAVFGATRFAVAIMVVYMSFIPFIGQNNAGQ